MESFSADWLALREPADHAARAHALTAEIAARVARGQSGRGIDIGCGAGSNLRYLLPRVTHLRHWTLVDHDAALLDAARRSLTPLAEARGVTLETMRMDLADVDALPLDGCALVAASALLDLVGADWMRRFAARCRAAHAHVLCTLNYDGRIECAPREADDEWIRGLVNAHQRSDKGLGAALGPTAAAFAGSAFGDAETLLSTSDWRLGTDSAALQRELVDGWASAAREMAPGDAERVERWRGRRLAHIAAGVSRVSVGHLDLAVFSPPAPSTTR